MENLQICRSCWEKVAIQYYKYMDMAKYYAQYKINLLQWISQCKADLGTEDLALQEAGANPHCKYALK